MAGELPKTALMLHEPVGGGLLTDQDHQSHHYFVVAVLLIEESTPTPICHEARRGPGHEA